MRLNFRFVTVLLFLLILNPSVYSQQGTIKGVIKDKKTGETIVGANVVIEGTTIGKSTGLDGDFEIGGLKPGVYTINISFISYKPLKFQKVSVENGKVTQLNAELEEDVTTIEGVTIKDRRKTDTEVSMIGSIRASDLVVSGISSQMISRSADRDAAEVVRRIPGITIIGNRFIVIRGLNERYNVVWLNNAATPSMEADVKAFSFDVIPSSLIDNILVYKTPAPELPGDFAGACVQIFTKNAPDRNGISVSYSASYRENATFKEFNTYQGSKTDWLGFDNGFRSLPSGFPEYHLNEIPRSAEGKAYRTQVGRMFNKIWSPETKTALFDNRASITLQGRLNLGKSTLGNITSLNYTNTNDHYGVFRAAYLAYDNINDRADTAYYFNDDVSQKTAKTGALSNFSFVRGGHSIEFRNLFNQIGTSRTTISDGRDNYGGTTLHSWELNYMSRTIYSGQLGGKHKFNKETSNIDWTLGYGYANKKQPDIRRVTSVYNDDQESQYFGKYGINFNFAANSDQNGRIYMDMKENLWVASLNYTQKFNIKNYHPELKAGVYYENKYRNFNARLLGFAIAKSSSFDWSLPYKPVDSIFADTNINATTGIRIDEQTNSLDSYNASNSLIAAYLGLKFPIGSRFVLYAGVRLEKNRFELNSGDEYQPVNVLNDTLDIFPSANLSFNITEKSLLRLAYGRTINRPEFREVAPFNFFVYDLKAYYKGNPELRDAYIDNFDLRYEYYPSLFEMVTLGVFYKHFKSPVEAAMYSAGSGWDYTFVNAEKSYSYGAELDIRKSFSNLSSSKSRFVRFFRNFTVVLNASVIKSQVQVDDLFAREKKRPMQGQSPYIVNAGIYYQNDSIGLSVNLMYNVVGKRIIYIGNVNDPHTYEMPRNLLDLTITKTLGKHFSIKLGINDIINQKHIFKQTEEVHLDTNGDGSPDSDVMRDMITRQFKTGRYYTLGVTFNF